MSVLLSLRKAVCITVIGLAFGGCTSPDSGQSSTTVDQGVQAEKAQENTTTINVETEESTAASNDNATEKQSTTAFHVGQVVQLTGSTYLFISEERWMDEKLGEDSAKAMAGTDPTLLYLEGGSRMKLLEYRDPVWKAKVISPYQGKTDIWWVRDTWLESALGTN